MKEATQESIDRMRLLARDLGVQIEMLTAGRFAFLTIRRGKSGAFVGRTTQDEQRLVDAAIESLERSARAEKAEAA